MSGRRVNFRESPPSSGVSSRYTNDSADYPERTGASASSRYSGGGGSAGGSQWTDLTSLQDKYRDVLADLDEWKTLAEDREVEAEEAKKQASEAEAKWRALVERNEQIEDEKKKMFKENKELKSQAMELRDEVDDLRQQLAKSNATLNEMQHLSMAPAYGTPGTSPHHSSSHLGHAETKSSRHSKEVKNSSSTKSSSNAGSGTSSGSSGSHSSSRAKVGSSGSSSSSTNTAKISRSGSRHEHHEKDQKSRLSQRFDHKDDVMNDSNASASSATSSSSQKHHKSGSSGNGSSGSNGSSASADSGSMRPPQSRVRRGSYVEGYGPGAALTSRPANMMQTPMSPNKGVTRSSQPANIIPAATVAPGSAAQAASYYGGHGSYAQPMHQMQYGMPTSSSGLISPRGDMSKDSLRTAVHIVSDTGLEPHLDPNYYGGYTPARDPRDPRDRLSRR
ncbi:hypothetical protein SEUCBS139899_006011 [Sporothrix eucalyptigena]|uniref:Uncharacterized protein n=1 Tax=Sporothrix eucalyptigena TaxID=1812306 RepID=A0ABP0CYE0_9PEZI